MPIKHVDEYRSPAVSRELIHRIKQSACRDMRLMEVCGTHTMAIFRSGIRSVLPERLALLSGPGCPVCVTSQAEIDAVVTLAAMDDVIVATFGDLLRVPGTSSSLQMQRAQGKDVRIVYSAFDALDIAQKNPAKKIVFIGIGFETTAPSIAAAVLTARQKKVDNFFVFAAHKRVRPALVKLLESARVHIDGFLLPGHVCAITGTDAFRALVQEYGIPAVVAGFEPADILRAVLMLVNQLNSGRAALENAYERAVAADGNPKARKIMMDVFEPVDADWRGIGEISESGLKIKKEFQEFNAQEVLGITVSKAPPPTGCCCGEILMGVKTPLDCPLYKKSCSPLHPVGPCMVSSEGTCAAYYRFHGGN